MLRPFCFYIDYLCPMPGDKISFSQKELSVLTNTSFLLSKAKAANKLNKLLGSAKNAIEKEIKKNDLPEGVDTTAGKISKGENYLQLPYMVLDFPKLFSQDSVFAIRTMFWWGKHFSITLHLQGKALEQYRKTIIENAESLKKKKIYFCVNDDPWQYHFEKDNFIFQDKISEKELLKLLKEKSFLKFSRKMKIENYKVLLPFVKESTGLFVSLLKDRSLIVRPVVPPSEDLSRPV